MNEHQHSHPHLHLTAASRAQSKFRLGLSLSLTLAFAVVEGVAGYLANSLALMTDAVHNMTDVLALALSWYALHLAERPAHAGKTFGYHRVGILAALVNSTGLVVISLGIFYEAYERLLVPHPVATDILIGVASAALVLNLLTAWLVSHGAHHDLNLRSAFLHLLGDVFSTIGAIAAGVGIWLTGLYWLDPLASTLIGLLILWNAWLILRETVDILLESTPSDIEMSTMVRDLMAIPGVRSVHDLHVWSIVKNVRVLTAHVVIDDRPVSAAAAIQQRIAELAAAEYGVGHCTIQLECENGCTADLYCNIGAPPPRPIQSHPAGRQGAARGSGSTTPPA